MKIKSCVILFFVFSLSRLYAQIPNRGCGTNIPSSQYDSIFQQKVINYLNTTTAASRVQSTFQIPVIIHVIHGGQAVGTFPNLAQGQLNSQVQVLNDDYSGIGFNSGTYPATAFLNYAMNSQVLPGSKDGFGNIKISNTGISFCLALKDSLGNILTEPGIERMHWNTISGATDPVLATTSTSLTNLMTNTIKPATIWSPNKYLNIWVSDVSASAGLLGFATFPPLSGLTGIAGPGTSTTDGLWCWAKVFGSQNIFSTGVYSSPYKYGRTATHELSHYLGIRHTWGDASCGDDFCYDTPAEQTSTYGTQTYPYLPNNCPSSVPPTGSEGVMFMNFADYTDDAGMYMFTEDQKNRMQTAMTNSPYRNQLGTHGICNSTTVSANFSLSSTSIFTGQSVTATDLSTASAAITAWNYSSPGSTPVTSTLQSPTFTFNTAGIFTISLTVNAGGVNASTTKTLQVSSCPTPTAIANVINPTCNGTCNGSTTLSLVAGSGGAPYTFSWTPAVSSSSVASSLCAGSYSCVVTNSCGTSAIKMVAIIPPPALTVTIGSSSPTVCASNSSVLSSTISGGTAPYTYNWNTGGTTANITVSPTVTPSTGYTLVVSDAMGCSSTKVYSITVNPNPLITVTPNNQTICAGKTATLNLSGSASYVTNPGSITLSTFTVNPASTTVYTITGTSALGCTSIRKDSVKVVNPPAILSNVSSNTICIGASVTFSNSGGASYTLSPSAFTGNTINITPSSLGTTVFTVTGSGPFGCINTKTVSITTYSLPVVSVTPSNTTICSGKTVGLSASGAGTYTWTTGANGPSIGVAPSSSTSYSVIGTNSFGCQNSSGAMVNVVNTPIVSINSPSTNVCFGYTMMVTANGAPNYTWSTGANTNTIIVQPFSNTSFNVIGTDPGGMCSDTAVLPITILPLPSVSASVSNTMACAGQTITLNASGNATTYYWQPINLLGQNQVVQIFVPTTYTVYGQGSNGCAFLSTAFVDVQTASAIIPVVTPSAICLGDSARLSVVGGNVPSWASNPVPNTEIVMPITNTSYTLNAVDFNGCVSNVVFNVLIKSDCDVVVYTGFTPNGDGINDFFIIENIEKYPNNNVYIFNRWGNKIFSTSRYDNRNNNWDGKTNGKPVTSGTYFYMIVNDNDKLLKKGWVEITN